MRQTLFLILFFFSLNVFAQEKQVFKINLKSDVPILIAGSGLGLLGFYQQKNTSVLSAQQISNLNPQDISAFDRSAVNNNNFNSRRLSDFAIFGSLALSSSLFLDKKIQAEWQNVAFLGLETGLISIGLNLFSKANTLRIRPFVYNPNISLAEKMENPDTKFSFYSGHANLSATACFFAAKIYESYYPNSKHKKWIWIGAASIPALTAYWRYDAGKHFPSDVIVGYFAGALIGYFVPHFHLAKNKRKVLVSPNFQANGLGLSILITLNSSQKRKFNYL